MNYKNTNKFEIIGGAKLHGEISIQTSKNAVLPIMSASLLAESPVLLKNCPEIIDVNNMISILHCLGAKVEWRGKDIYIDPTSITNAKIDCELTKSMRSSVFMLGSILAKFKTAFISSPGGCDIGKRPIDIHIKAMKKLKVEVEEAEEFLFFDANKAKARTIKLSMPSVGATENLLLFACTLKGKTTIKNCAKEPEVVDLCDFLCKMGAKIIGVGTERLTIHGVNHLRGVKYTPISDRIVTGTLMCAVAISGGNVTLNNVKVRHIENLIDKLRSMGCQIKANNDIINISSSGRLRAIEDITTGYYPDFPTDMQSLMLVTSTIAKGKTKVNEQIFENRFLIVPELEKMGADIVFKSNREVIINGVDHLIGSTVYARDLRGGASLVLAGLATCGLTVVENVHFIDRGYEHLEDMLSSLGVDIKRI